MSRSTAQKLFLAAAFAALPFFAGWGCGASDRGGRASGIAPPCDEADRPASEREGTPHDDLSATEGALADQSGEPVPEPADGPEPASPPRPSARLSPEPSPEPRPGDPPSQIELLAKQVSDFEKAIRAFERLAAMGGAPPSEGAPKEDGANGD